MGLRVSKPVPVLFRKSPRVLVQEVERFALFGYGSKREEKVEGEKDTTRKAKRKAEKKRDSIIQNGFLASSHVKVSGFRFPSSTNTKMKGKDSGGRKYRDGDEVKV